MLLHHGFLNHMASPEKAEEPEGIEEYNKLAEISCGTICDHGADLDLWLVGVRLR